MQAIVPPACHQASLPAASAALSLNFTGPEKQGARVTCAWLTGAG